MRLTSPNVNILADLCVGLFKRTDNEGTAYMRRQVRFTLENTAYPETLTPPAGPPSRFPYFRPVC